MFQGLRSKSSSSSLSADSGFAASGEVGAVTIVGGKARMARQRLGYGGVSPFGFAKLRTGEDSRPGERRYH
jgi:hypothetical protein